MKETFQKNFPKIFEIYSVLIKKKNFKNLTYFLILNLLFMFVEVLYGILSNCLGLLTDGAHMLLDCTAVIIGLYSSYLSEKQSNDSYNFGYYRSEVLGTFINSVFLFFIAIYIVFESIERFIEPKKIYSENLILISFLGLIVNIIGLFFAHDHNEEEHHHNENLSENKNVEDNNNHHHHHNENLYAIYIHILADTLGSVAVMISTFLIRYYNLNISDPICSLCISIMIIYSTFPVLINSSKILLHISNENVDKKRKKIIKAIKNLKLCKIANFDIWLMKSNFYVVDVKLVIEKNDVNDDVNNNNESEKIDVNVNNEINNKIKNILKENKINEFYIEIFN